MGTPPKSIRVNNRVYRWPDAPLVVVCLDGSSFEYIREATAAGLAPYLMRLISRGSFRMVRAAMPTFTNPNNISIVTGAPPATHGITGNFFLDPESRCAVLMNDPSFLRAETILAAFSRHGARVGVITAKDKLRRMLGEGITNGACVSAEQEGIPVYSAELSQHVLRTGAEFALKDTFDILYLSTSDYVQHLCAPETAEAREFYGAIDAELERIDKAGATLVITADHGINAKADSEGQPRVIFLQTVLDELSGRDAGTVILPITDPYVLHHGALGSFATIYLSRGADLPSIIRHLAGIQGIDCVLDRRTACSEFSLPPDRIGDIIVCSDADTVLGSREADHDLKALRGPLRSHGGLAERVVPMFFNCELDSMAEPIHNYDAFSLGLNHGRITQK